MNRDWELIIGILLFITIFVFGVMSVLRVL